MYDGFTPQVIEEFPGLLTRLDAPDLLAGRGAPVCRNASFTSGGVDSREGTRTAFSLGAGVGEVVHAEMFFFGGARQYLFLMADFDLYHVEYNPVTDTVTAGPTQLIAAIDGNPSSFKLTVYGNLIYLFFSNGAFGVTEVRVWDKTNGTIDRITITPVAIGAMAAATGGAGQVTAGLHKIKVVFVTRTGFESSPTTGTVEYTAAANDSIDLTSIPLWVAGAGHVTAECTKRIIIMTAAGLDSYFLALEINDNTTTIGTIDIADEELVAGRNFDNHFQYQSPMANLAIGRTYHERLVANGDSANATLAYISELGSPQSFRADTGFLDINHDDGYRLLAPFQIRDVLYFLKEIGLYATQDNGEEPDSWPLSIISHDVGTISLSGVSDFSDEDFVVIQDFRGMYYFDGSPPRKMSKDIQPTWDGLNVANLLRGEVHINSVKRRIYNLMPFGASSVPNKILVCDYQDGWSKVKWSEWDTTGFTWRTMIMDTGGFVVFVGGDTNLVRRFDDDEITDNADAIDFQYRLGLAEPRRFGLNLFGGFDIHCTGQGALALAIYGPDSTLLATPAGFALSVAPDKDLFRRLNIRKERIFLELSHFDELAASKTHRITIFAKPDGMRAY